LIKLHKFYIIEAWKGENRAKVREAERPPRKSLVA
jgi:hypothetical protein